MIDYLGFIRSESEKFNGAMAAVEASGIEKFASAPVPSCAGWTAADLTWHLAEVQYFWASIVEGNLSNYADVVPLERPADSDLIALQAAQGIRLADLLTGRDPNDPCWSWHSQGKTVGWVLRRQAHESLIHRVDAELTAELAGASQRTTVDQTLSADGLDEILTVMLDIGTLPSGLRFESSNRTVRLSSPELRWDLTIGRVVGTADDGTDMNETAIDISMPVGKPDVRISASASELNLWLWRRDVLPPSAITGDSVIADELYELAEIHDSFLTNGAF